VGGAAVPGAVPLPPQRLRQHPSNRRLLA
jgi:hypothetical protein